MSSKNTVIPRLLRCKTTLPDPQVSSTCSNWVGSFILELLTRFELVTSSLPRSFSRFVRKCVFIFPYKTHAAHALLLRAISFHRITSGIFSSQTVANPMPVLSGMGLFCIKHSFAKNLKKSTKYQRGSSASSPVLFRRIRAFPRVGHGVGQAETSASKKPRIGFVVIFRFAVSLS